MRRVLAAIAGLSLGLAVLAAPAHADQGVTLTAKQLTQAGFTKKPNVVSWEPGTASLSAHRVAQWQDVVITGKAPNFTPTGQLLTLQRFVPSDTQGSGTFKDLNITTSVNPNGSFVMHMQLGYVGTYGYRVGYSTDGPSPEFIGFQFQLAVTGDSTASPQGSANAVILTSRQLARAGFTRSPNVVGWGGTATISRSAAPAGAPITISGTAPDFVAPGAVMQMSRFVGTDKKGSGHLEKLPISTKVRSDRTFELTFELNVPGTYGYGLGVDGQYEWVGIEFQVTTT